MEGPCETDWAGKLQSCQIIPMGENDRLTCWIESWRTYCSGAELGGCCSCLEMSQTSDKWGLEQPGLGKVSLTWQRGGMRRSLRFLPNHSMLAIKN